MDSLSTFLVASAFLAAIALVWAQLWGRAAGKPDELWREVWLVWCYIAVLVTLVGLAAAGYEYLLLEDNMENYVVPWWSLGLFIAGLVMTTVMVANSLLSATWRLLSGTRFLGDAASELGPLGLTIYFASWALAIIGVSLWIAYSIAKADFPLNYWQSWLLTIPIISPIVCLRSRRVRRRV